MKGFIGMALLSNSGRKVVHIYLGKAETPEKRKMIKMRIVVIWRRGRKCDQVKMHMVSVILHLFKRVVMCMLVLTALFLVSYCKFEIFKNKYSLNKSTFKI